MHDSKESKLWNNIINNKRLNWHRQTNSKRKYIKCKNLEFYSASRESSTFNSSTCLLWKHLLILVAVQLTQAQWLVTQPLKLEFHDPGKKYIVETWRCNNILIAGAATWWSRSRAWRVSSTTQSWSLSRLKGLRRTEEDRTDVEGVGTHKVKWRMVDEKVVWDVGMLLDDNIILTFFGIDRNWNH